MNRQMQMSIGKATIEFSHEQKMQDEFFQEVVQGLHGRPRRISPKYFYDSKGAILFEEICEQPEYYPSTTEVEILETYAKEIAANINPNCILIEPGSGSCEKIKMLMDEIRPAAYVPVDISHEQLQSAASDVAATYSWLKVHAICADITAGISLPDVLQADRCLVFYPGSSIGNFDPEDAVEFMATLAAVAGQGGSLLIGVDLVKDHATLNAAYNDAKGVTAEFNLNLLHRINRELDADFDVEAFDHYAFYNEIENRIEMHLISTRVQDVSISGHTFKFVAGDTIHTESSYKYTQDSFHALAESAGFQPVNYWTDAAGLFGLYLLRVAD